MGRRNRGSRSWPITTGGRIAVFYIRTKRADVYAQDKPYGEFAMLLYDGDLTTMPWPWCCRRSARGVRPDHPARGRPRCRVQAGRRGGLAAEQGARVHGHVQLQPALRHLPKGTGRDREQRWNMLKPRGTRASKNSDPGARGFQPQAPWGCVCGDVPSSFQELSRRHGVLTPGAMGIQPNRCHQQST